MSDRALSMLVHAEAKVGKSTFAVTGPGPILYVDAENAARFLRKPDGTKFKRIYWNPMEEAPPAYDGTWEMCVVPVEDWKVVLKTYEFLKTNQHPFRSLVIDSISEIQVIAKRNILGSALDAQMKMQDWGKLLGVMGNYLRAIRDLTKRPDAVLESIVLIAMSRKVDGKMKPHLEGQIKEVVSFFYDATVYLYVEQVADPNTGEVRTQRSLWTEQHPQFEAGNRVGFPQTIPNPNISQILDHLFDD